MFSFCQSNSEKKGKHAIETFKKIDLADVKEFAMTTLRFSVNPLAIIDKNFIGRFINNQPHDSQILENKQVNNLRAVRPSRDNLAIRKIMKSEYEDLLMRFKNKNESWTDPDFPPNLKSYGTSRKKVLWKRIPEIIKNAEFVSGIISPSDILQGRIGNCYFLSAISGLAQIDYRIKNIFPNLQINRNGFYMARIMHKGVYQEVVIDDYFPCTDNGQLLGALPANGKEIWVMILEKCWAKLFGSYDAIDGGLPNQVLHAFSSAPTFHFRITKKKDELDLIWSKLVEADENKFVVCCGTNTDRSIEDLGLVIGHAYTILRVYDSPCKMLKLRNPWGEKEWIGPANENDKAFWSKVSRQMQLEMSFTQKQDGIFYILWEDFIKYFVLIDICRINDSAHYLYVENDFQIEKPNLYEFNCKGGEVTLAISQENQRGKPKQPNKTKYANATIVLAKKNSNFQRTFTDFQYVKSKGDAQFSDFYMGVVDLQPGDYVFASFVEGASSKLNTVSIYSDTVTNLSPTRDIDPQEFLSKTYLDHSTKNISARQVLCENPLEWACIDILTEQCGFGYSVFHLDKNSKKKLGLQFNEQQYEYNSIRLLEPYKRSGQFKIVCQIGHEIIVLCRLQPGNFMTSFAMPTPTIYRLR